MTEVVEKILKKFTKDELKTVMESWGYLGKELSQSQKVWQGSKVSIIDRLISICKMKKITVDAVALLDILYIKKYSTRKTWSCYMFKKSNESRKRVIFDARSLCKNLQEQLDLKIESDVCVKKFGEVLWIRIYINAKQTYLASNTVYMVHYPHTPFIVMSPVKASLAQYIYEPLLPVFKCDSLKDLHLTGHNVDALLQLGINKYSQGNHNVDALIKDVQDSTVKKKSRKRKSTESIVEQESQRTWVHESQLNKKRRIDYLEKNFGTEKLPALEKIEYQLRTRFRGNKFVPQMIQTNELFKCKVKFEGDNVLEGIKNLVKFGIADAPLSQHIGQAHKMARNNFSLKNVESTLDRSELGTQLMAVNSQSSSQQS